MPSATCISGILHWRPEPKTAWEWARSVWFPAFGLGQYSVSLSVLSTEVKVRTITGEGGVPRGRWLPPYDSMSVAANRVWIIYPRQVGFWLLSRMRLEWFEWNCCRDRQAASTSNQDFVQHHISNADIGTACPLISSIATGHQRTPLSYTNEA